MARPRLTDRVLRGILAIESCCGGMLDRSEMSLLGGSGLTTRDYDEARDAQQWAADMRVWREERRHEPLAETSPKEEPC